MIDEAINELSNVVSTSDAIAALGRVERAGTGDTARVLHREARASSHATTPGAQ